MSDAGHSPDTAPGRTAHRVRLTPLTDPAPAASSRRAAWLASDTEGNPVGSAFLRLFTGAGQSHLAELELAVHPAERRRGVGTRLLAAAVDAARTDGRHRLIAEAEEGSAAALFLPARGFRQVLRLTHTRLDLAEADPEALARIAGRPHPGYRLAHWDGTVPDDLAESFAASRRAMDDMPMDDTDYGTVHWDVARVRAAAGAVARRGDLLSTVVALDTSDGSVAGFTELVVPGDGRGDGRHYGTGVLPEHRGRGLGRWMKAEAVRRVLSRHPKLGGLLTDTADSNTYMRSINDALGYRPTHRTCTYQQDLT